MNNSNWHCPNCQTISINQIQITNKKFKKDQINIYPILPTCKLCGTEIFFNTDILPINRQKIIVITGCCGSGKTTIAENIIKQHGFYGIEGDSVIHLLKTKYDIKDVNFDDDILFNEIIRQLSILLTLHKDIVISHVILEKNITKFDNFFSKMGLINNFFLLMPDYPTTLSRTKTRTCFNNILDEKWVRYFHEKFKLLAQNNSCKMMVIDNSKLTVEETLTKILQAFF